MQTENPINPFLIQKAKSIKISKILYISVEDIHFYQMIVS